MILPKGRWHVSPGQFPGPSTSNIIYSALDDWKRSGLLCLPNQNEFMHETYKGTSMPFSEFRVLLQFHHTELSLSTQKLSKPSTPNLVSTWHIWSVSLLQTWQNKKFSIKAEQSVAPIYKQEPKVHSTHSCWRKLPLLPTEQILIRFDLPQMLHPLYYLLSCLQY